MRSKVLSEKNLGYLFLVFLLLITFYTSFVNYLLFHTIAELFSIIISLMIFIIALNSKKYIKNNYLLFIGIAYFFISIIDLLHTITYKGFNMIPGNDKIFYANQLWIIGRYMESLSLLVGFYFLKTQKKVKLNLTFIIYLIVTTIFIFTVFVFKNFPVCFIKDVGQTNFKLFSEYIIISILIVVLFFLIRFRNKFTKKVFYQMFFSIIFTMISELAFTFYISNYGISNLIGHFFKIFSFYLIYLAIVENGIKNPFEFVFRELELEKTKLKEAIATKDKFFSIISHDLRAPFNSLIGLGDVLVKRIETMEKSKIKEIVEVNYETSKSTLKFLENLLTWSKLQTESIQINKCKINFKELFLNVLFMNMSNLKEKEIELKEEIDESIIFFGDKEMITTVLGNLISNSIKYTRKGGEIEVLVNQKSDILEITISDTGIGMSKKMIDSLFTLENTFSREGTNNEKGSGLGLLLCKEFIDIHNGTINIESEVEKGTIFTINIPNNVK